MPETNSISALDDWAVGEDQTFIWPIYQMDNKTIQDITDWTIEFRMALTKGATSVFTKAMTIDDPEHGLTRLSATWADTHLLQPHTYWYEVWRTDIGHLNKLAWGDAVLKPSINP